MSRWAPGWGALAIVTVAAISAAAQAAPACRLRPVEMPVRIVGSRPVATLTLNGAEVPMLVDSGAFFSMLTPSVVDELKLVKVSLPYGMRVEGYTGAVSASMTKVERVGLLGAQLPNVEFIVGGSEIGAGIKGIIGRNLLATADTEYDLAHGMVRLVFPQGDCEKVDMAYWAPKETPVVILPLDNLGEQEANAIRVRAKVNGHGMDALLDTGAPQTSMTLRAAKWSGLKQEDLKEVGRTGGLGQQLVTTYEGRIDKVEMGGEVVRNNVLRIDDVYDGDDMLVGLDYFLSHRIYVSALQRKVYITWNGGPVFAQGTDRAGSYDRRFAALPPEVSSEDADALARRGAAALAAGDKARALEDLDRAIALAPKEARYRESRARIRLALGDQRREALADLDEALQRDPALDEARALRVSQRLAAEDRDGALADLKALDERLPPSSHLRADLGRWYVALSQWPEALRQWKLWIDAHPKDLRLAGMLNARCRLRARLGEDLPAAVDDCERAMQIDPSIVDYRVSLGWVYLRMGEAAQARKAFDRANDEVPHAVALYGRGLADLKLGRKAQAQDDLTQARKLMPEVDDHLAKEGLETAPAGAL
jgi:tetratricopeptide (TPR) repeat protein/predicted aspartyl protease